MIHQKLDIGNKALIGAKIIEADVESPYSGSYITIMTTDGKKYNISPECEDSHSSEWFDIEVEEPITVAVAHANQAGGAMEIIDSWAIELEELAEGLGYNVVDISGQDLTYERMTEILTQTKPALLINFSFAQKTCLMGNPVNGMTWCTLTQGNGMPSNLHAVSGTAVISYSNYAGGQLGQNMIKAGCPVLAGFGEDLIFVSDTVGTQDIFKESLLPLAKRVLEGRTMGEAVEATRSDLSSSIQKYKAYEVISLPLFYNMKQLTLLGDPNWKL